MGNAGFRFHVDEIENSDPSCFAAGTGRGWDGDERLQYSGHRISLSDGGVDVLEKVGGVGGIQIGRFCRIHARATTDGDEAVKVSGGGDIDRFLKGCVRGLHADTVEELVLDAMLLQ